MKHRLIKRILTVLGVVLVVLVLVGASAAVQTVRRSWPQETGTLKVPGLQRAVEVLRDQSGIPHIYASNSHDLFLVQGYIQAQDRFWQMDFWRHAGSGRLSEMFGKSQLKTDQFLRTLGWARVAQQEVQQLDPDVADALQAYADGVNAYLAQHRDSAISLEYAILKLLNGNYQPEPWQPLHTLTWGKAMAWDLGDNMAEEIQRTVLSQTLTRSQIAELFPPYPDDQPIILSDYSIPKQTTQRDSGSEFGPELGSILETVSDRLASVPVLLAEAESGLGSNNWVIGGQRTATGKPMLADDPHLATQLPSIWHEVGLHCTTVNAACPYNVVGFSFPGMLGVIIGHTDRIAWGVTNVGPDVQDLYIEKINPTNPNQYEVDGKWVDMKQVTETIQVAGGSPITQTVRYTRHGPIISDTYQPLQALPKQAGPNWPQSYAIALKWTALEPSRLIHAIPKLNRAQNWQDFRAALQDFDLPSQNFIYADVDGNIGYQMPGRIPVRASGNGRAPVPGWTNQFEWKGYIPFEQLPFRFNPKQGYIATANNPVVPPSYPHLITADWDYGFRAKRIVEMIESQTQPLTLADLQRMHGDNRNLNAETLVPILMQIPLPDDRLQSIRQLLQNWDFQDNATGSAPAIFEAFWKHLLAQTFHDELPQAYWPTGGGRWYEVIRRLVRQPDSFWWDNKTTPAVEQRDQIFQQAFSDAVRELEQKLGKNPERWHWGDLHTVTFRNLSLGKSGVAPIEALLNRGPFPVGGGKEIVNATGWNAAKSYEVDSLPSLRMLVDLADLNRSIAIHSTGESGHAFHRHYLDMATPWRQVEYWPMRWDRQTVADRAHRLLLQPQS